MARYKIKRSILLSLLAASKKLYPNEFFCLLSAKDKDEIVDEFVVVPAEYSKNSVFIKHWLIPFDKKIVGSLHSHPLGNNPSFVDLTNFPKFGKIHLITFPPFCINCFAAFDNNGKNVSVEVID
ncbi:MAG: hypothetical protein N3D73_01380 [Candidatus Diapherotrites archaeon]|nr:hypothetical protein [Candidatus Diapherotrites archaeon]